jgi:UDPglucose--hexose-1-phosphate uridylyltransferase
MSLWLCEGCAPLWQSVGCMKTTAMEFPEIRWNPILREWVIITSTRNNRPVMPRRCPFCPNAHEGAGEWDVKALPNRFPSLIPDCPEPSTLRNGFFRRAAGRGLCEVVLYTNDHKAKLHELSQEHVERLVRLLIERYKNLSKKKFTKYVLIFENRGAAVGVTNDHPHAQIYALPFIPPLVEREVESSNEFYSKKKECIFCRALREEISDSRRIVYKGDGFVAFVPFYARWSYEVHLYPTDHIHSLADFEKKHIRGFSKALIHVSKMYDGLFNFKLPYMMILHQAPINSANYSPYHLHVEYYPIHRNRDQIKFTASVENTGVFLNDNLPEAKAKDLKGSELR